MRCVAGTVGILSMMIFGAWRGDRSRRFALSLAKAMQLTNILRDVEEDAAMGRLYLPQPLLLSEGMPLDPASVPGHPALPGARRVLGAAARAQFRRARADARAHDWVRLMPALCDDGPLRDAAPADGDGLVAAPAAAPRLAQGDRRRPLRRARPRDPVTQRIFVVGAGLAGLAAAVRLSERPDLRVILVEASPKAGRPVPQLRRPDARAKDR